MKNKDKQIRELEKDNAFFIGLSILITMLFLLFIVIDSLVISDLKQQLETRQEGSSYIDLEECVEENRMRGDWLRIEKIKDGWWVNGKPCQEDSLESLCDGLVEYSMSDYLEELCQEKVPVWTLKSSCNLEWADVNYSVDFKDYKTYKNVLDSIDKDDFCEVIK